VNYWCLTFSDSPSVFWASEDTGSDFTIRNALGHGGGVIRRTAPPPHDLQERYPGAKIERTKMGLGECHPRIFRPTGEAMLEEPHLYKRQWSSSVQAVRNLLSVMDNLFRYLEPHPKNAKAFGHELRQLLILACTEVESSCKAVLKANEYPTPTNDRWSTKDYVKVAAPLHLREWEVGLRFHPDYPRFKPFEHWNDANPTKSLPWYNAYNAVKHDREDNFQEATLESALFAVGAAYLMVPAQFGLFQNVFASQGDALYVEEPTWAPSEYYVPPTVEPGASWTTVNCTF
jgi:hypothetical protein